MPAAASAHAASSSGTSSKIVASFNSALGFFLLNRLESRGNFKFCFTSGRPVCSTASLYGRSASRLNTSIYPATHLCLNTQSHSLAASRAMVLSKHFNNQAWTLSARGKLYGTSQCSISARNVNVFSWEEDRRGLGVVLPLKMRITVKHLSMFAIGMNVLGDSKSGLALTAAPSASTYHSRCRASDRHSTEREKSTYPSLGQLD